MNTTQKTNFKNWREFIDALPLELQSNIRKFVLWEQRNEQRGKRNYLNSWDFPKSVIKCDKCKECIGNKTIKKHNSKYIIIYRKYIYGEINRNLDPIENIYCSNCIKSFPDCIKCLDTLKNCFYTIN